MLPLRICFSALVLIAAHAQADGGSATPYRPTVSDPAELSALRQFELEFGWQYLTHDDQQRYSLPYLIKFPFHPNWGLLIGGESWINQSENSQSAQGIGNTALLLKHYYPINENLALGFEAGAVLPSARKPLGERRTDYLLNLIVSQDIGALRLDLNFAPVRHGLHAGKLGHYQYVWAIAASYPLGRWTLAGEFSGYLRAGQGASNQWLGCVSYQLHPRLVLDAGVNVGLSQASSDIGLFSGFTVLLGP